MQKILKMKERLNIAAKIIIWVLGIGTLSPLIVLLIKPEIFLFHSIAVLSLNLLVLWNLVRFITRP
jgi:hypothetical protein